MLGCFADLLPPRCDAQDRSVPLHLPVRKGGNHEVHQREVEEVGGGEEPEDNDLGGSELFAPVAAWRHETLALESRKIVAYAERSTSKRVYRCTFEYVFDGGTGQPVLIGAFDLRIGKGGEEKLSSKKKEEETPKVREPEELDLFPTRREMKPKPRKGKKQRPKSARLTASSQKSKAAIQNISPPISPLSASRKKTVPQDRIVSTGYMSATSKSASRVRVERGEYGSSVSTTDNHWKDKKTAAGSKGNNRPRPSSAPMTRKQKPASTTPSNSRTQSPEMYQLGEYTPPPPVELEKISICRGKYCHLFSHDYKPTVGSLDNYAVGYRSIALAKVEEDFDEGKSLMERYAQLLTELGVTLDTDHDELAILSTVVDDRLRRIVSQCQNEALDMFSKSMRVDMGVDRKWELYDFETASRKVKYSEAMKHIPPARAYDQLPVCRKCFTIYSILDRRRDLVFDLTDKSGGYGGPGKRAVGTGASAAKQHRRSKQHASGVGSQKFLGRLTSTERRSADARKKLLRRQEKEILEMKRRVAAAKAKKAATFVMPTAPPRTRKSKLSYGERLRMKMQRQTAQDSAYNQQLVASQSASDMVDLNNTISTTATATAPGNALVVTSGEIGFDGKKFVFKPPTIPRQLALSDVRAAGFSVAQGVASVETSSEQKNVMTVTVGVGGSQVSKAGVSTKVPLPQRNEPWALPGDEGVFDILPSLPTRSDQLGLQLGLDTNDFIGTREGDQGEFFSIDKKTGNGSDKIQDFLDSPFGLDDLCGGELDAGLPIYEPGEDAGPEEPRSEMRDEIEKLKEWHMDFDFGQKVKKEEQKSTVTEPRIIKASKVKEVDEDAAKHDTVPGSTKETSKPSEERTPTPNGEYVDDFDYDNEEDDDENKRDKEGGGGGAEVRSEVLKKDEPADFEDVDDQEPLGEYEHDYADDFIEDDKAATDLSLLSDGAMGGLDDMDDHEPYDENTEFLPGLAENTDVPLGVLSGSTKKQTFRDELAWLKDEAKKLDQKFSK